MNEMVERVAEALAKRHGLVWRRIVISEPEEAADFREQACAAIAAMREPTTAMEDAGDRTGWCESRYGSCWSGLGVWQAMIDAALAARPAAGQEAKAVNET